MQSADAAEARVVFHLGHEWIYAGVPARQEAPALRRAAEVQAGVVRETIVIGAGAGTFDVVRIGRVAETGEEQHRRANRIRSRQLVAAEKSSRHVIRTRFNVTGAVGELIRRARVTKG